MVKINIKGDIYHAWFNTVTLSYFNKKDLRNERVNMNKISLIEITFKITIFCLWACSNNSIKF